MTDPIALDLKDYCEKLGIRLPDQAEISEEAIRRVGAAHGFTVEEMKANFDGLILETEKTAYDIYKDAEAAYGAKVMAAFVLHLTTTGEVTELGDVGDAFGRHFGVFDRLFLSMAQSRKSRAGRTFELIHNSLFTKLGYPFDEQEVIEGKPDFVMPSVAYYKKNPLQSIVFTAKRTLRERWRQIVTEGTRGIGFYLATIDDGLSQNQLQEMSQHRIFVVCPKAIKEACYPENVNVLSFERFFEDHLDPKMKIWKRDGVI